MAWSFNTFTGNMDLTGSSGAVVFEGEVETFADLPEVVGDPPVGSSYLVRTSTGVWLVNRRQAGIWIRRNNTGVRATDWEYGGDYPVNSVAGKTGNVTLTNSDISGLGSAATANLNAISDADLRIVGSTDSTKKVALEVDTNVPANTTVTLTAPSSGGTIARLSDIPAAFDPASPGTIGGTTPSAATFTNLTANTRVNLPNTNGTTAGDLYRNANTLRYRDSTNTERLLLNATDNLSNLTNTATARANLGLGGWATLSDGATLRSEILTISDGESADYIQFTAGSGVIFNGNRAAQFRGALGLGTSDSVTFGSIQNTPIGSTTRNTGAFTTLSANNGTLTASAPVLDLAQTWNNAGVTFTGLRLNITDTASAAASNLLEIQVGGVTRMMLKKSGTLHLGQFTNSGFYTPAPAWHGSTAGLLAATNLAIGSSLDTILERGGAGIIEQRNLTNAQTYRIYNTYTDASNYERGFMRWSSNVLEIGTEAAGTGTLREMRFLVGAVPVSINSVGQVTCRSLNTVSGGAISINSTIALVSPANGSLDLRQGTFPVTVQFANTVSGSGNVNREQGFLRWTSNVWTLGTEALGTGTTARGMQIGTSSSQLLGFYGVAPVDQPATVSDPAGGGTVDTEARTAINAIIDRLQELGLIA